MNALLLLLLTVQAPALPNDTFSAPPQTIPMCQDLDQQDPMMNDPHGPPIVCMMDDGDADFPLTHGSCGRNCTTHVPAGGATVPTVTLRFDFACPGTAEVRVLSYRLDGQQRRVVLARDLDRSTVTVEREIRPFSKSEVASVCARALGGSWPRGGTHANTTQKVEATLTEDIELLGACGSSGDVRHNRYRLRLPVSCEDQAF